MMEKIAILIDGGFYLKKIKKFFPDTYHDAAIIADEIHKHAIKHCKERVESKYVQKFDLFRTFFYDSKPINKKLHYPISKKLLDLSKSATATFRNELFAELVKKRKMALRLGRLDEKNAAWQLRPKSLQKLLNGQKLWSDLIDDDFAYYACQKIVDTKIGMDITLLAEKRLVSKIVLIAGDSDFVPAAKHARREGIDVVLDPMWSHIAADLNEHIDGLVSVLPNPTRSKSIDSI